MNSEQEVLNPNVNVSWVESLDHSLPQDLNLSTCRDLPAALGELNIRLGIQRWPHGHERHFHARLAETLLQVMQHGAKALGEHLLPPHSGEPLDSLRVKEHETHEWSEPITDLDTPLWLALVNGGSRHFAIDYKLVVKINTKWNVAPSVDMTPRQLLSSFGFDPSEFSLYLGNSSEPLPPEASIHIHRGECFEAQKDGRYGLQPSPRRGSQSIEDDVAIACSNGIAAHLMSQSGQRYVEVSGLEIPSPPWSESAATIAIAVPATYPQGGLDGFYLEQRVNQNGIIPYQQSGLSIDGRAFVLISWHYAVGRDWNPNRDDLQSHITHCRGYFLKRGIR